MNKICDKIKSFLNRIYDLEKTPAFKSDVGIKDFLSNKNAETVFSSIISETEIYFQEKIKKCYDKILKSLKKVN